MKFDFTDKIAVITGGTSGIGLAIAEKFGELGAKVAVCGTNADKIAKVARCFKKKGLGFYAEVCDVADSAEMFAFADHIEEHFGGHISIWVSNASIYPQCKIVDTPEDMWDRVMAVNMKSVYIGGIIASRKMRDHGGVLINASSFASVIPSVGSGVYAATKAATTSLTKTLAAELAPYNIRVCAYIPGVIATPMTMPLIEKSGDSMLQSIALNRFGESVEVANAVMFLASDYASYISGTTLEITGGKYCTQNSSAAR